MSSSYVMRFAVIHNSSSSSYCSLNLQCMHTGVIGLGQNIIFSKKFRSHSASSPGFSMEMTSESIEERAIHVCLDDLQDIAPPPIVKTYPLVDFISVDLVIQFASPYPSRTAEYLL